ncbi:hypothetical protein HPB47_026297 [Ixodes persulcatus]|uniref:Uncharacterized protein n=1 Tax=Ixodes persulcatus TaxID=34615 RepID=A0AC60Q0W2_IXOPE|nr:hypothetical protein HPB47_026297 [Ixodes persulcatus]
MYALIRFLEDLDSRRHVVPVHVIHDFHSTNKGDFDNKAVYTVFWDDDVGEDTGDYNAQILMLGARDDTLVSSKEVAEASKNAQYWKSRCLELREDNIFLQEQVKALTALLGSKLFRPTLSYWGTEKSLDVAAVAANLTNILSEKIQNSIKVERRLLNHK